MTRRTTSLALGLLLTMVAGLLVGYAIDSAHAQVIPSAPNAEPGFQILPHDYLVVGAHYRIFVKMDCQSGQAWRFHAGNLKWTPIAEPAEHTPGAPLEGRYELIAHEFHNRGDSWEEAILRADTSTGRLWVYQAMQKSWRLIP